MKIYTYFTKELTSQIRVWKRLTFLVSSFWVSLLHFMPEDKFLINQRFQYKNENYEVLKKMGESLHILGVKKCFLRESKFRSRKKEG